MGGNGKGGDKRRRFSKQVKGSTSGNSGGPSSGRSVRRDIPQWQETGRSPQAGRNTKRADENPLVGGKFEKNRGNLFERPRWIPPQLPEEPIPIPDCPWCGKPVKDISAAISDKESGEAVHFDCVIARLSEGEQLESGDTVCYIGGGRFGVVHFNNPPDNRDFKIKKIFEWENKDNRSEWRRNISGHFSVT
jgi:hypothetical protein